MAVIASAWSDAGYVLLWVINGLLFIFATTLFSLEPVPSTIWGTVLFILALILSAIIYAIYSFGILWQILLGIVILYVFFRLIIGFSVAVQRGYPCCTVGSCGNGQNGCGSCCGFSFQHGNNRNDFCPPNDCRPRAPFYPPRNFGPVNQCGPNPVNFGPGC